MADAEKLSNTRTYIGSGTPEDPYVVDWDLDDPEDPYNWPNLQRWIITAQVFISTFVPFFFFIPLTLLYKLALSTWTVSFGSSSYSGSIQATMRDLNISYDVAILGISLYVLGFALGCVYLTREKNYCSPDAHQTAH